MMFPFRRRPASRPNIHEHARTAEATPPEVVELHLRHLDYDLQSLSVESLSHYIEPNLQDERFRVH